MIAVVTAFAPGQWERAKTLLRGIRANWPSGTEVHCYHEGQETANVRMHPLSYVRPWLAFKTDYARDPLATGRAAPHMGWPPKAVREGYYARTDAMTAARKVFAIQDAAQRVGRGVLIWVDPDARSETTVTGRDIEALMGRCDLAVHNGRTNPNTAVIGFWLPNCLPLIRRWADHYAKDEVFRYRDWHADATLAWALERHHRLKVGTLSDQPQKNPWACERVLFQRPLAQEPAAA